MRRALLLLLMMLSVQAPWALAQAPDQVPGAAAAAGASGVSGASGDPYANVPAEATEIAVRMGTAGAELTKGKPTAGDVIEIRIHVSPENGEGALPDGIAAQLEKGPVEWGDGRILWWKAFDPKSSEIVVGLTSYKPGKLTIKPIPFSKAGKPVFTSMQKEVEFTSVGGDKMKDEIYPPESVGLPAWFWIVLGLLALGIVLAALHYLNQWNSRRKERFEELARAPRVYSPPEEFERVKAETEGKGHIEKGSYKPHYFALSDAAKRFLGKAYRFDAEERTTREMLVELERLEMPDELVEHWEKIFDEMDIVKFTDQLPDAQQARTLAGRLVALVKVSWAKSPVARELMAAQQLPAKGGK